MKKRWKILIVIMALTMCLCFYLSFKVEGDYDSNILLMYGDRTRLSGGDILHQMDENAEFKKVGFYEASQGNVVLSYYEAGHKLYPYKEYEIPEEIQEFDSIFSLEVYPTFWGMELTTLDYRELDIGNEYILIRSIWHLD
ncbi:hypothetical protein PQO01_01755 [Lentisphaera marina]|uniref:hypothetical protein n=1 Tax=Lentisphaera marina TaxID=1111041 RepID=UPI0023650F93|nr:hypothetical protein [Lentisphaera marina]MDD7983673.1 hypothetical protein [Lentisphaera marina]